MTRWLVGDRGIGVALAVALAATTASAAVYSFQEGDANGYTGSKVTYIDDQSATTPRDGLTYFYVEKDPAAGQGLRRGLVEFPSIFGTGPGHVPLDAALASARLELYPEQGGHPQSSNWIPIYPMLRPWDEATATWNSPGAGPAWGAPGMVAGTDYAAAEDGRTRPSTATTWHAWDVTNTVVNVQNGATNYGWAMVSTGNDAFVPWSDDYATDPTLRPRLVVETIEPTYGGTRLHLFRQGGGAVSDTDGTYIFLRWDGSGGDDTNFGSATEFHVEEQSTTGSSGEGNKRTLVGFFDAVGSSPGQVPLGSTVVAATLAINCTNPTVGPLTVHRVLQDWDEDQATYNNRLTGTPWATPGMQAGTDYEVIPFTRTYNATSGSFNEFDVTAMAQLWADGAPNYGVVIRTTTSDGAVYSSDDAAAGNRPMLLIETATPGWGTSVRQQADTGPDTCMATYINGRAATSNYGTNSALITETDATSYIARSLIAFPDLIGNGYNEIPEGSTVRSAKLRLHINNDTAVWTNTGDTLSLYQVLTDWDEADVTWTSFNNGGAAGTDYLATALDTVRPLIVDGFYYLDVTQSVQSWADGMDNYGWILINPGSDMGQWDSDDYGIHAYRPVLVVEWVPEPTSLVLLGGGLLAVWRRRRRSGRAIQRLSSLRGQSLFL